jgi:MoaD family protein
VTVTLRLFAAAREAAGRGRDEFEAGVVPTVGALLDAAAAAYGETFRSVLASSRVWVNGDEPAAGRATPLANGDEVAVLPPVSGGIA